MANEGKTWQRTVNQISGKSVMARIRREMATHGQGNP